MMTRKICIIAAMTKDGVIGKNGSLPWRIREDLGHFKTETMDHVLIMGRKTHESILAETAGKPLPSRTHVVLTRNPASVGQKDGIRVAKSPLMALKMCDSLGFQKIFIAGGGETYKQFMDLATHMVLTIVKKSYDGDTYFPEYDRSQWNLVKEDQGQEVNFQHYEKKQE